MLDDYSRYIVAWQLQMSMQAARPTFQTPASRSISSHVARCLQLCATLHVTDMSEITSTIHIRVPEPVHHLARLRAVEGRARRGRAKRSDTVRFVISMGHSPGSLWERYRRRFFAPAAYRLRPPRSPGIFVRRVPRLTCYTWRWPTRMAQRPLWPAG